MLDRKALSGEASLKNEAAFHFPDQNLGNFSITARDLGNDDRVFKEMDMVKKQISQEEKAFEISKKVSVGAAIGVGASLLGGYAVWAFRGMSLVERALSSIPFWKSFDPLSILRRLLSR
jgi:hypothetical protein